MPRRGAGGRAERAARGPKIKHPYKKPNGAPNNKVNAFIAQFGLPAVAAALTNLSGVTFKTATGPVRPYLLGKPIAQPVLKSLFTQTLVGENFNRVWGTKLEERSQRRVGNKWNTNSVLLKLSNNNQLRPYFNSRNTARTALTSLFGKATAIMPSGLFNAPTGNDAMDIERARAILAAARLDYDVTHSTPTYLQAMLGDYLETVSFTVAAAATPGTRAVFWKQPSGPPHHGLDADPYWAPIVQYFAPDWPYKFTVILESEVAFDRTIKTIPPNTSSINKKFIVDILKQESKPTSQGAQIINWQPLEPSPYKGWWFGKPDAVVICREERTVNGRIVVYWIIKVMELKIGLGKAEGVPAEAYQLVKVMKSIEMLLDMLRQSGAAVPPADRITIKGYFVPWFYGVMMRNKAPNFRNINATVTGPLFTSWREFVGHHPNYNIEIVRDGGVFEREFGMNQAMITSTLDAKLSWWYQKTGKIMRNITGHALGTRLTQNQLESMKNAAKIRIRLYPNNRDTPAIKEWLETVKGLVLPSKRWNKARKYNVGATKPASETMARYKHRNWGKETGIFEHPERARLGALSVRRAVRKARREGVPLPANYPELENNGNNGSGSNTGALRVAASRGFRTLVTPDQIAQMISSATNFNNLRRARAYLNTVETNQATRNVLKQQFALKRVQFTANALARNPSNTRFIKAYEEALKKAGIDPSTMPMTQQIANLAAQERALLQGVR